MKSSKSVSIFGLDVKMGNDMVSLTDLWKAAGSTPSHQPAKWLEGERVGKFINKIKTLLNTPNSEFLVKRAGRNGGTFAHWQIALAYAKWLSPELHLQVNDVYRRFQEADPELIENAIDRVQSPEDLKRIEARVRNKQSNVALNGTIIECGGIGKTCAFVANNNNVAITGKTAKELRKEHNLPEKASTRPHLDTDQMIDMAFLERLERKSLEKLRPKGHDAILTICDCAIDTVKEALARHI